MGQRLILDIIKNNERIANIYYHWSAYTETAFQEAQTLYSKLEELETNFKSDNEAYLRQQLLHAVQSLGGGFDANNDQDLKIFPELNDIYDKTSSVDRNQGLIAFSHDTMAESDDWGEGSTRLDLDTLTVDLYGVIYSYDLTDSYDLNNLQDELEYSFEEDFDQGKTLIDIVDSLPTVDIDIENIPVTYNLDLPGLFKQGNTIYSTIG